MLSLSVKKTDRDPGTESSANELFIPEKSRDFDLDRPSVPLDPRRFPR